MATRVNGSMASPSNYPQLYCTPYFYYTVSETATQYKLTLYGGIKAHAISDFPSGYYSATYTITGTGQTTKSASKSISSYGEYAGNAKDNQAISSFTWTWNKTTAAAAKTIKAYDSKIGTSNAASKSFTVPALASYAVTYNANGGTGQPATQTKYYGQNLTLSTSRPTRSGYTFKGWATSSSATTATYQPGATYTANAALVLYAVWDLNFVQPQISNVSVERCLQDGTMDDEGTYALVSFYWTVDTAKYSDNVADELTVDVGTEQVTCTVTGASGSQSVVVGSGAFDVNAQYDVTIEITDIYSGDTAWLGSLGYAVFPIDISANGHAVALRMTAPDDKDGVFIGTDMYIALAQGDDLYAAITALGWESEVIE